MSTVQKNPVGWFEIYVNEMQRAKAFYEEMLGLQLTAIDMPDIEMFTFPSDGNMQTYGASGALVKMDGFSAGKNSVLVYFSCDDCAVEESRVEAAGGSVQKTKESLGEHGYMALIIDTEGNMIGLHSMN